MKVREMGVNNSPGKKRRRALLGSRDSAHVQAQISIIYERDHGICQLCMQPCEREDASRGHIIPVRNCTKEMARSLDNMQLEHKTCNQEQELEYDKTVRPRLTISIMDYINKHNDDKGRS